MGAKASCSQGEPTGGVVGRLGKGSQESAGETLSQALTRDIVGLPACPGGERNPLHSEGTFRGQTD